MGLCPLSHMYKENERNKIKILLRLQSNYVIMYLLIRQ